MDTSEDGLPEHAILERFRGQEDASRVSAIIIPVNTPDKLRAGVIYDRFDRRLSG